jgi:SET and MYND domain-containing protein 4
MSFKSKEVADTFRNAGNKHYSDKNFFEALIQYNASLCYAPHESELLGLAYANRSAVYFEMKLYEMSLRNIEFAKLNGYPVKNISTLDRRAEKCRQQIEIGNEVTKDENSFNLIKLTREGNFELPFVAKCLEMRENKKFGRFIITNCDLHVGEIIAIEKPYFKVMKSDSRYESCEEINKYQRCANCLMDNFLDLIPCTQCSSCE